MSDKPILEVDERLGKFLAAQPGSDAYLVKKVESPNIPAGMLGVRVLRTRYFVVLSQFGSTSDIVAASTAVTAVATDSQGLIVGLLASLSDKIRALSDDEHDYVLALTRFAKDRGKSPYLHWWSPAELEAGGMRSDPATVASLVGKQVLGYRKSDASVRLTI